MGIFLWIYTFKRLFIFFIKWQGQCCKPAFVYAKASRLRYFPCPREHSISISGSWLHVISQFQVTLGFPDIQPLNVHTLFRPFSHPFPISIPASNLLTYQIHVKVFVKILFYPLCKEIIHPHFEKINIIQNGWLQSRMCGHISSW